MKTIRSFLIPAFLVSGTALCVLVAPALSADETKLKEHMPATLNVALLRQDDTSGEALLRLSTVVNMTGCPKISALKHEVAVTDIYLDVTVKGYTIDTRDMPRAPQYACKQNVQYATADIPLDRKLIEDNKIQQIRLALDKGRGTDYYVVNMGQNNLELTPRTQEIFHPLRAPRGGGVALHHWYYPENTIILLAPAAPQEQRDSAVIDFARASGLTDLAGLIPGFTPPGGQDGRHYYVDQAGTIADKAPSRDLVSLSDVVQARRPGAFE